ncbi:MFS transporter [Parenemella sanctibonifatiensis]|uniref:MFS transporter n=1 Tax=Parenemella sanctibonifatiensis TaxID=2016505 RepID=UPI001E444A2F|nr:MFS transporter [Parenemella sanctibonifatiensis]
MTDAPTPAAVRRARGAVAAFFFTNGLLLSNLLPRLPEIKAALELDNTQFGIAVAAFPAGAFLAGLASPSLIRRFGSGPVAVVGTVVSSLGVISAAVAPAYLPLILALLVAGGADAITDVAQNAHGLRVQRHMKRSIINSFHAVWSVGAVTGGLMSAGAIALRIPLPIHLGASGGLAIVVACVALRFALPGHDEEPVQSGEAATDARRRVAVPRRTWIMLAALVLIAVAGALVEDAGNSWATLYLSDSLEAPHEIAAMGYIAMVAVQTVARFVGDAMVDRMGQRAVLWLGGAVVTIGMGAALAFPTVPGTILGFAAAGFGCAAAIPLAMQEADDLPGLRAGMGLTIVTWLLRVGMLASPPIVGAIADATELRVGLLVAPISGLVIVAFAGLAMQPRRRPAESA